MAESALVNLATAYLVSDRELRIIEVGGATGLFGFDRERTIGLELTPPCPCFLASRTSWLRS